MSARRAWIAGASVIASATIQKLPYNASPRAISAIAVAAIAPRSSTRSQLRNDGIPSALADPVTSGTPLDACGTMMATTALSKTVDWSYDDTLREVTDALHAEGFGVLTQIDLRETLRSKVGATLPKYTILGACNPPLAYRALQTELDAGLLMPCNVIVYESGARTVVKAIDPGATLAAGNPALQPIAEEVRAKLELVLARLA